MKEHFGCDPADILAAVGPSICQDCYEVSGDVIEKFKEAFDEKDWDNLFYRKTMENISLIYGKQTNRFSGIGNLQGTYCGHECLYALQ